MLKTYNGRWTAIGIVSSGNSCGAQNAPGIYTRVDKYIRWICWQLRLIMRDLDCETEQNYNMRNRKPRPTSTSSTTITIPPPPPLEEELTITKTSPSPIILKEHEPKLYVVGGQGNDSWGNIDRTVSTVNILDLKSKQWSVGEDMEEARYKHRAIGINNQVFVIGGLNQEKQALSSVE